MLKANSLISSAMQIKIYKRFIKTEMFNLNIILEIDEKEIIKCIEGDEDLDITFKGKKFEEYINSYIEKKK